MEIRLRLSDRMETLTDSRVKVCRAIASCARRFCWAVRSVWIESHDLLLAQALSLIGKWIVVPLPPSFSFPSFFLLQLNRGLTWQ